LPCLSKNKGYLVPSHYNFLELEKRHYYSSILKFATTIHLLPDFYHFIRLPGIRPHCQTVFVHRCFVYFPLHSLTCGPHRSASSSTSSHPEVVHGQQTMTGEDGAASLSCSPSWARGQSRPPPAHRVHAGGGAGAWQPLPEICRGRGRGLAVSSGVGRILALPSPSSGGHIDF
jgi:hypothetical protein